MNRTGKRVAYLYYFLEEPTLPDIKGCGFYAHDQYPNDSFLTDAGHRLLQYATNSQLDDVSALQC